ALGALVAAEVEPRLAPRCAGRQEREPEQRLSAAGRADQRGGGRLVQPAPDHGVELPDPEPEARAGGRRGARLLPEHRLGARMHGQAAPIDREQVAAGEVLAAAELRDRELALAAELRTP